MLHRLWVLIGMGCLLGYSANATAIEIHPTKSEMAFDHSALQAAVAFWLVIKLTRGRQRVTALRLPLQSSFCGGTLSVCPTSAPSTSSTALVFLSRCSSTLCVRVLVTRNLWPDHLRAAPHLGDQPPGPNRARNCCNLCRLDPSRLDCFDCLGSSQPGSEVQTGPSGRSQPRANHPWFPCPYRPS